MPDLEYLIRRSPRTYNLEQWCTRSTDVLDIPSRLSEEISIRLGQ